MLCLIGSCTVPWVIVDKLAYDGTSLYGPHFLNLTWISRITLILDRQVMFQKFKIWDIIWPILFRFFRNSRAGYQRLILPIDFSTMVLKGFKNITNLKSFVPELLRPSTSLRDSAGFDHKRLR